MFFVLATAILSLTLGGCAGMPTRDALALVGAAVGAEGSPHRPILGAAQGAAVGYVAGVLIEGVAPRLGEPPPVHQYPQHLRPKIPEYSVRPGAQPPTFFEGYKLSGCNTSFDRVGNMGGSRNRVTSCHAERHVMVFGRLMRCTTRFTERLMDNLPPRIDWGKEQCFEVR